jgi:hypothetical protein
VRVRGDALCGFGTVVFFEELQVDIGGGIIGVIEFATVDAEELEGLPYNKLIEDFTGLLS